ncbi:MAG: DUF3990 domain-containing protein [Prevotella sp.]|nr:DUF3990 domain-containing protein [Prevotella sp.]MDO5527672.1 DUF3990 domain-containing protein [Prevotella sp.]
MILFHGAILTIECPLAHVGRDYLDFGKGFYLTKIENQAIQWAKRVKFVRKSPVAVVNKYEFDYEAAIDAGYRRLCMNEYDRTWLDFITESRKGMKPWEDYDIIEGGVANDRVIDTVEDYMTGRITAEQALGQLKFAVSNHQICVNNQEVIDNFLTFKESIEL